MDDELDPTIVDDTDLQQLAISCCADEHREVVKVEDSGRVGWRVPVRVQCLGRYVGDPPAPSRCR
jgi:hypothetical protein